MIRQGFFSLIIVAAIGVLLLSLVNELTPTRRTLSENAHLAPDVVLEGADVRTYSPSGTLEYHILAERVEHRVNTGETRIELPTLSIHSPSSQWLVTAHQGSVSQTDRSLLLQGEVQVKQQGDAELSLSTDTLRYELEAQKLQVPGKVEIRHQGGLTRAGRLDLDLQHNRLQMAGRVETRFNPSAAP